MLGLDVERKRQKGFPADTLPFVVYKVLSSVHLRSRLSRPRKKPSAPVSASVLRMREPHLHLVNHFELRGPSLKTFLLPDWRVHPSTRYVHSPRLPLELLSTRHRARLIPHGLTCVRIIRLGQAMANASTPKPHITPVVQYTDLHLFQMDPSTPSILIHLR